MARPENWQELGLGTALQRIAKHSKRAGKCREYLLSDQIRICVGGVAWTMAPHQVVFFEGFGWIPEGGYENIVRTCGNQRCVEMSHLALSAPGLLVSESAKRKFRRCRKLTDDQVSEIRIASDRGESLGPFADRFGVARSTIYCAARGDTYRDRDEAK